MSITNLDPGSAPNDGTGTTLRAGALIINANYLQLPIIGTASFISPSTSEITNDSSTVFEDSDLAVSILTKSGGSKIRVQTHCAFATANPQQGYRLKIQYQFGGGGWLDTIVGNQTANAIFNDSDAPTTMRLPSHVLTQFDSPGIGITVNIKMVFAAFVNGTDVGYSDFNGFRFIQVDEVMEN